MATYGKNSPYYTTPKYGTFLDLMEKRDLPMRTDDTIYTVERAYQYRPDLLAYDLYGDAGLWWVFQVRNPNIITDPIGDFVSGLVIRLPKQQDLVTALGL